MAISDEIRRFVLTSIPSVPYLEAVLLLRASPGTERSAADVGRALYLPESDAADLLQRLWTAGIVRPGAADGRFVYAPRDPTLTRMLDDLAAAYSADLVGITNLVHDATQKNARRFADAFKLRKEP